MMNVRDSERSDPAKLAPNLRKADVAEVRASAGHSAFEALRAGYAHSAHCRTLTVDDRPVGMFGVVPDLELLRETGILHGVVWYLGSDEATANPFEFMRLSREWLELLKADFDSLGNWVDSRNSKHLRWLKAIGFKFVDVNPYFGFERRTFLKFELLTVQY